MSALDTSDLRSHATSRGRGKRDSSRGLSRVWKSIRKTWRRLIYRRSRKDSAYYREVVRLAQLHGRPGGSVLDVGAHEAKVLSRLSGFGRRVALDRGKISGQRGVETIRANFVKWEPTERFDLVLCLQVLEHVPDAATFARRLLAAGDKVIISVPYRWPRGKCADHVHDPVDEEKLRAWTGRDPTHSVIVTDQSARWIAVYEPIPS